MLALDTVFAAQFRAHKSFCCYAAVTNENKMPISIAQ
jgi:hypothetical protein